MSAHQVSVSVRQLLELTAAGLPSENIYIFQLWQLWKDSALDIYLIVTWDNDCNGFSGRFTRLIGIEYREILTTIPLTQLSTAKRYLKDELGLVDVKGFKVLRASERDSNDFKSTTWAKAPSFTDAAQLFYQRMRSDDSETITKL